MWQSGASGRGRHVCTKIIPWNPSQIPLTNPLCRKRYLPDARAMTSLETVASAAGTTNRQRDNNRSCQMLFWDPWLGWTLDDPSFEAFIVCLNNVRYLVTLFKAFNTNRKQHILSNFLKINTATGKRINKIAFFRQPQCDFCVFE